MYTNILATWAQEQTIVADSMDRASP